MKTLRVALVGCGPRSKEHMVAVDVCDGMEMIACCDPAEKGQARFREHYASLPVYADMGELLAKEKPDVVAICTRELPRCALTLQAIDAGVRGIVLEKPMARTVDEARRMAAAARAKGVVMVVSHQMRFCDEFIAMRDAIQRGEIGKPYLVRVSSYGQLMEQGPHMVDMLLWQLGDPEVDWVMAAVADIEAGRQTVHPAPAFTVGYITFKNGMRAVVECGRIFQKALTVPENVTWMQKRVQVLGTEGMADTIVSHYCRVLNGDGWRTLAEGPAGWNNATNGLYAELARVMTAGGVHRNNVEASLRGFEIIHALYQSALVRDRVHPPIPGGAAPLEEIMGDA